MALDINGYNDTFRAFTDFAAHAKSGSTFAQIDGMDFTAIDLTDAYGPQ